MASNTGCTSSGELAITFRMSAVAVCRSSASLVSLNSRTFWIAITAWSAKVCSRLHMVGGKQAGLDARHADRADDTSVASERHQQPAAKAPRPRYVPDLGVGIRLRLGVGDLRYLTAVSHF